VARVVLSSGRADPSLARWDRSSARADSVSVTSEVATATGMNCPRPGDRMLVRAARQCADRGPGDRLQTSAAKIVLRPHCRLTTVGDVPEREA
jgi:hypothetical protein